MNIASDPADSSIADVITNVKDAIAYCNKAIDILAASLAVSNLPKRGTSGPAEARPSAAARPKLVQGELPLQYGAKPAGTGLRSVIKLPDDDARFEYRYDPARQAAGRKGGWAATGRPRTRSSDRRMPGEVMVKSMSIAERREYWRWLGARKRARKLGVRVPTWEEFGGVRAW